jgi:hypothetical protein
VDGDETRDTDASLLEGCWRRLGERTEVWNMMLRVLIMNDNEWSVVATSRREDEDEMGSRRSGDGDEDHRQQTGRSSEELSGVYIMSIITYINKKDFLPREPVFQRNPKTQP